MIFAPSIIRIGPNIPLILLALLVGFIILMVKGSPAVRWCVLIIAGIVLLPLVAGLFLVCSHQVPVPQPMELTNSQSPSVHVVKEPTLWQNNLEEEFVADTYSSTSAAAYGLGTQLYDVILAALENQPPQKINIRELDNSDFMVLERLREGLSGKFEDAKVVINRLDTPSPDNISIRLEIEEERSSQTLSYPNDSSYSVITEIPSQAGTVRAIVHTGDDKHIKEVRYDRRQWIHDTDAFRSQVGIGSWAVYASSQPAVSKEQALNEAFQLAQQYITEKIGLHSTQLNDERVHGFVIDEYSQRLQGLSGPIWRAAVLLDVSPEHLQTLQQSEAAVARHVRKTWIYRIFSLAGMILLISILYAFVNALTKGYYSVIIGIIAIGILVGFVLLMWFSRSSTLM